MASWTDGAAYAPIERPYGFASPEVDPLADATTAAAVTPGALPPPQDFSQNIPAIPLQHVATEPLSRRNPSQPFQVSGGLMTLASSMGKHTVRDPRTPFHTQHQASGFPDTDRLPPPTGEPLALDVHGPPMGPTTELDTLMSSGMARRTSSSKESPQEMSTQRTLVFLAVACCVLGFTIGAAAPYMLIAAGALSLRASTLTGRAGIWAIGSAFAIILAGFILIPGLEVLLGRLASLSFGIWFVSAALGRSRKGS